MKLESVLRKPNPADFDSPAKLGAMTLRTWRTPHHLGTINQRLRKVGLGKLDRLAVFMPPRHGKSILISQFFPAWFLLVHPERRVILCSYEAGFAASWGRKVRDVVTRWGPTFGRVIRGDSKAADSWEIEGHGGGMQTAGVGGPILGKGADLLILDDLTKNAEEALSPVYREKTWDWLTSTAYTRLEPGAAVVQVQQRWHTEDVGGRTLASEPNRWDVLNLPAIAEVGDQIGRKPGEPLWPDRYPLEELRRREALAPRWFAAQYQQKPLDLEGGFFKGLEKIPLLDVAPTPDQFTRITRFWDLASTEAQAGADPDWTAGVKIGKHRDGRFIVLNVKRVRVGPSSVRALIRQTAELDGQMVNVRVEREGGASGKITSDIIVREDLAGYKAASIKPTTGKAERAEPWGAQIEAGNVVIVKDENTAVYLAEHQAFPSGSHDDMVDASSGAFADTCLQPAQARIGGERI